MSLIFYDEAAEILSISVGTLKEALKPNRNVFTRAGRQGVKGLLIKEQVLLFTGLNPRTGHKKRLSLDALTSEERALWHRYASEYAASQNTGAPITPDIDRLIQDKIKVELARQAMARIQDEERIQAREATLRAQEKERLENEFPFLMRELILA